MRVHLINQDNYDIAFFPETKRIFKVNSKAIQLIEAIQDGVEKDIIISDFGIDEQKYNLYYNQIYESKLVQVKKNEPEKGKKHLPRLVLHLTNDCNMRCKYCYANGGSYGAPRGIMEKSILDKTLDVFYKEFDSIKYIQFFGGEPLLNIDLLEYACQKVTKINETREVKTGFAIVINGTLIDERFINLVKKYDIYVTVSYDGNPFVHDKIRPFCDGNGTSELIIKNVNWLKKETGQPKTIEVTYNQYHIDEKITIVDVIRHINSVMPGIPIHLVPAGGSENCDFAIKDLSVFADSIHEIMKIWINSEDKKMVPMYSLAQRVFSSIESTNKGNPLICDAGLGTISVSTLGDVYPCFMFTDQKDLRYGNVFDEVCVFYSTKFKELQEKLKSVSIKDKNEECKYCYINKLCNGCLGLNSFHSGNPFKLSKSLCDMYRKMVDAAIIEYVKLQENTRGI